MNYDLALQAAPRTSTTTIRMFRADCLRALGRVADAETDYKPGLNDPQHRVVALTAIALLQANDHTSDYANEVRKELERTGLTGGERSSLLLCLGRLHENARDYDNAFFNFARSRKLESSKFSVGNFVAQVDDVIRNFTPEVFEKFREYGHNTEKPIFIVGMPRSGTTMTESRRT